MQSTKRICISSLYIGTSHLEKDLVCYCYLYFKITFCFFLLKINCLSERKSKYKDLDMTILLDYNRSTREAITLENGRRVIDSSKLSLLPLVCKNANVNFYLTPNLSGWRKWIQRKQKWNELSSLHHMKLYIFDDNLVISGANLSDTYFTNRQDRYVLIRNSPLLCDYFDQLIKSVSKFSFLLRRDGEFSLHSDWHYDPRRYFHQSMFQKRAQQEIMQLNERFALQNSNITDTDTIVFPLLQMRSIGIKDEEHFTSSLFQSLPPQSLLHMATGYFNLTKAYQTLLLNRSDKDSKISILMASENANGFFNGNGILRYIPLVYTHYVKNFLKRIQANNGIRIWYYNRPDWSFHAKGIWLFSSNFAMTIVGSTNFGYRSVYRDNEAQIVIVTKNKQLVQTFEKEHRHLTANSKLIHDSNDDLPKVPFWVSCFATFFRSYF